MSSNTNHIIPVLSRDNYEEYFLLYVDEELTPDAKKAVDDFVLLHPDLKEELHLLCSTKLTADAFSFENKEDLFADCMVLNTVDESLLLYIDNELPSWEAEIVEAQLANNETFAQQHQLLLKTKLYPDPVVYPFKKELYRRTERRIVPYWLRIAAAVVLFASGTVVWMNKNSSEHTDGVVAAIAPKPTQQQPVPTKPVEKTVLRNENKSLTTNTKKKIASHETAVAYKAPSVKRKTTQATFSKPHTADNKNAIPSLIVNKKTRVDVTTDITQNKIEPAFNNSTVTPEIGSAYVQLDATGKTTDPVHPVAITTNERSGGVKTFLRKATRFIERRTGIKTVNDDDELLVGAVALKL